MGFFYHPILHMPPRRRRSYKKSRTSQKRQRSRRGSPRFRNPRSRTRTYGASIEDAVTQYIEILRQAGKVTMTDPVSGQTLVTIRRDGHEVTYTYTRPDGTVTDTEEFANLMSATSILSDILRLLYPLDPRSSFSPLIQAMLKDLEARPEGGDQ